MDALAEAREIIDRTDEAMAELFVRRMEAVKTIAAYKQARGLPALDEAREREVLRQGALRVPDGALRGYYLSFLRSLMDMSKEYQRDLAR